MNLGSDADVLRGADVKEAIGYMFVAVTSLYPVIVFIDEVYEPQCCWFILVLRS